MRSYIYLANPYTHRLQSVKNQRFRVMCDIAAKLKRMGHIVFSPIVHSHSVSKYGKLNKTLWRDWEIDDTVFLLHSEALWVIKLPGWDKSVGVLAEIKLAKKFKIPIYYYTVDDINEEFECFQAYENL